MNRLMIAGTGSSCGKTTVVCALLSAYKARGLSLAAFKCGPDYIDPMFHREIAGVSSYNLDPFFCDGDELRRHLGRHGGGDLSILEAAMGYYDGIACTERASSYEVARETETPVVLVINARHTGNSLGAVLEGFTRHRPDSHIYGVVWNCLSAARRVDMARVAEEAGVRAYGYLPFNARNVIESRHLGLVTAAEVHNLRDKLACLGRIAQETLDLDGLLALSRGARTLRPPDPLEITPARVRVAVARDNAFCFLYSETLDALVAAGCEITFFSPLRDARLPDNIGALYLPGGYPELHAEELSQNTSMLSDIAGAVRAGLPTLAECGGFMYLHKHLDGHPMVGVIDSDAFKTDRLQRFGYITIKAKADNLLCVKDESILGHEFHYWDSVDPGDCFIAHKAGRDARYACVHASPTMFAGFPHVAFTDAMARRFAGKAKAYNTRRNPI